MPRKKKAEATPVAVQTALPPLEQMRVAIQNNDMAAVCRAYEALTGQKVVRRKGAAPVPEEEKKEEIPSEVLAILAEVPPENTAYLPKTASLRRPATELVEMTCARCQRQKKIFPSLVTKLDGLGDWVCDRCLARGR